MRTQTLVFYGFVTIHYSRVESNGFVEKSHFNPATFDWWGSVNKTRRQLATAPGALTCDDCNCETDGNADNCGIADDLCPCCIQCESLEFCDIVNFYVMEDKYYPTEGGITGSCDMLDDRVQRLDIFGPAALGYTFRDTAQCRSLVLDYICLWWASENDHYDNRCNYGEDIDRPCRSYCVQVGMVCANSLDWLDTCHYIDCASNEAGCTTGPDDIDYKCAIPEYISSFSAAPSNAHNLGIIGVLATISVGGMMLYSSQEWRP